MNPLFIQAEQYYRENRFAEALEQVEKALELHPKQTTYITFKGLCLIKLNAFLDAEKVLKDAIRFDPNHDFSYYAMANLEINRGRYKEAEKYAQLAIDLNPIQSEYYGVLALCRFSRHEEVEKVKELAKQGLSFDPHNSLCQNVLAMIEMRHGKKRLATQIMEFNLEKNKANSFSLSNQGWNFLHQGNHTKAREFFSEALKHEPAHEWARIGILQAIKCKFPMYRWILRFLLFLSRKSPARRMSLIFGIYMFILAFSFVIAKYQSMGLTSLLLFGSIIYITWFGDTLANLFLLFHDEGKKWLKPQEKQRSIALFSLLALSGVFASWALLFKNSAVAIQALGLFLLSIPVGMYFQENRVKQKRWALFTLITLIVLLCIHVCAVNFLPEAWQTMALKIATHGFLGLILVFCLSMLLFH